MPVKRIYQRLYNAPGPGASQEHKSRSPVSKDRDRIVHSGALRRLQRKSQIVGVQANDFFRTRLTHTYECAQIGRGIALRSKNSQWDSVVGRFGDLQDLVEAACLAHDLGHPPFGHNGEQALQRMMKRHAQSLFEGNAQSFRIVTNLELKYEDGTRSYGLNLTRTTLKAILKYPWDEDSAQVDPAHPKFCVYADDEDRAVYDWLFNDRQPVLPGVERRTLATDILDSADDIAYAAHDFEDGVWSGMIPLHLLIAGDSAALGLLERTVVQRHPDLFKRISVKKRVRELLRPISGASWAKRPFDRGRVSRGDLKNFTAQLIGEFIEEVTPGDEFVSPDDEVQRRLYVLTGMAWAWMIRSPQLATLQYGQQRLIEALFEGYWENPQMLPQRERWERINDAGLSPEDLMANPRATRESAIVWRAKARLICDHIAGMTDLYALHVYGEMFGGGVAPGLRLVS
jgi:dGTPase